MDMTTRKNINEKVAEQPAIDEVIHCEKLTKRYHDGDILAVDRLDLAVYHGEIFGLLGPNGAGKTTTVGMLTTLVVPTSGKAVVAGIDVVTHPALVKQVIGVVSQTNNLDRALTVWENLYYHGLFFGMKAKESREAADKLLVDFRLSERGKAEVMAISGGNFENTACRGTDYPFNNPLYGRSGCHLRPSGDYGPRAHPGD